MFAASDSFKLGCSGANAGFCAHCPPGKFANIASGCVACPANKYQFQVDAEGCTLCQNGQYQNDPGQAFCDSVPTFEYVRRINSTYAEEVPCPKQSAVQNAFGCSNGGLRFEQNFWHDSLRQTAQGNGVDWEQQSVVDNRTQFYDCGCRNSCIGNISCIGGSHGLLCSQCDHDYFKEERTGDCVKCGNWAENEVPLIIALALLAVGIAFYVWWKQADDSSTFKLSAAETASRAKQMALRFMETCGQHLKTKLKLFVGFFQVS